MLRHRIRQAPGQMAPVLTSLMSPLTFAAYAMAVWRLGADMNWFSEFIISKGLLSRWQVWLALAVAAQLGGHQLARWGKTAAAPRMDA